MICSNHKDHSFSSYEFVTQNSSVDRKCGWWSCGNRRQGSIGSGVDL